MSSKKRASKTTRTTGKKIIAINLDSEIHETGKKLAQQSNRSFSNYLEVLIENAARNEQAA